MKTGPWSADRCSRETSSFAGSFQGPCVCWIGCRSHPIVPAVESGCPLPKRVTRSQLMGTSLHSPADVFPSSSALANRKNQNSLVVRRGGLSSALFGRRRRHTPWTDPQKGGGKPRPPAASVARELLAALRRSDLSSWRLCAFARDPSFKVSPFN